MNQKNQKTQHPNKFFFKNLANSANYTTQNQFTNLRQPTYDSDSEADIFGTPESQNSSCSDYAEQTDKEIRQIIKFNKAEEKKQKLLKKEEKDAQKSEQKRIEQTLIGQDLVAFRYYEKEKAKEAKKLAALQKKTQGSLPGLFGKVQTEKQIILQPDKVTTQAGAKKI